jgi:chemotaxis protein MotB
MMPKRKVHVEENADSWLMSYADMITLLLAFFIIFVSTSEPKQDKLTAATRGMQGTFGSVQLESPFDGVYREVQGIIASHNADRNVSIEKTPRGLLIELSTLRFYGPGSADLASDQQALLDAIARQLAQGDLQHYSVEVEGHTDDVPAQGGAKSNWDLSAARAARITDLLIADGFDAKRLRATGFADTQPAVPNVDAKGTPIPENREKNQRVVIRIEQRN